MYKNIYTSIEDIFITIKFWKCINSNGRFYTYITLTTKISSLI